MKAADYHDRFSAAFYVNPKEPSTLLRFARDDTFHAILSVSEESFALIHKIFHSTSFRSGWQ